MLCICSTIASAQDRHTREHQHQHHRHHNIQRQHQHQHHHQQQHNLIKLENVHGNKTFGGHAWFSGGHSHSDATENELEKRGKNGWSGWTNWSTCSRSCDGGIAQQIRRCHSTHCRGEPIRYRICNMQVNIYQITFSLSVNARKKVTF